MITPALRALADARFATAAISYQDGLTHMLRLSDKALKSAVLDLARAVLDSMSALAKAKNVEVDRSMPAVVFKRLTSANVLPVEARGIMLATASFRHIFEHQGGEAREARREIAEAAMGAASVAITYLATFLPEAAVVDSESFVPAASTVPADDDIPF